MVFRPDVDNTTDEGGLCRIQNGEFQIFDKSNTPELLSHKIINIRIGNDNNIWFESILEPFQHRTYHRSALIEISETYQVEEIGGSN